MNAKNPALGSDLDSLLDETQELSDVSAIAIKRVIAWELSEKMRAEKLSKTAMASRMATSRSALDRLLDPDNTSVTLHTLDSAARAVGKRIRIELI